MTLGEKIKSIRTSKNLSQKEVASDMDIDRAQYSRIENDKVEPNLATLKKVSAALDVGLVELFSSEEPVEISSFDKNLVERVRLIDSLEESDRSIIFSVIDMAVSRKRLKDTLVNALEKENQAA